MVFIEIGFKWLSVTEHHTANIYKHCISSAWIEKVYITDIMTWFWYLKLNYFALYYLRFKNGYTAHLSQGPISVCYLAFSVGPLGWEAPTGNIMTDNLVISVVYLLFNYGTLVITTLSLRIWKSIWSMALSFYFRLVEIKNEYIYACF